MLVITVQVRVCKVKLVYLNKIDILAHKIEKIPNNFPKTIYDYIPGILLSYLTCKEVTLCSASNKFLFIESSNKTKDHIRHRGFSRLCISIYNFNIPSMESVSCSLHIIYQQHTNTIEPIQAINFNFERKFPFN